MAMRPFFTVNVLLALYLGLALPRPAAAAEPNSIHAIYTLKRDGQPIGRVEETFQRNGARYRLTSEAKAESIAALFVKGPLRMISEGEIDANGLKPAKFERQRNNKTIIALFDWDAAKLTSTDNGAASTDALPAKTQDRLSAMYQFMFTQPRRTPIDMPMTNGKKPVKYVFGRGERSKLSTPAGSFDTLKTTRQSVAGDAESATDNSVEVWLAVKRKYLPVRLKIREDGALYEQDLVKLEIR